MPTGQADRLIPTLRRVVLARQSAARSDGELLGAFVATRDAEAFAELVRRHGPMVLGVCRRLVGDRTTAEDAFQAVFLVLARRAAAVRPREQVGNWLYGVAYRTALKARTVLARRRSREKQVDVMPEPTAPAASPSAWNDLQPVIDEELARLPDKLRLPVVLCDLEGRPQREVAKHLNVPPATLATRLASARRTLAQRLTRRGVTLSGGALAGLLGVHAASSAVPPALSAGVVRAVEAFATGTALNSLVSANALQLSEGVMRMMMLAKLKAVAVTAVTVLALTTGLGLGLVPASAGDDPAPGSVTGAIAAIKPAPVAQPTGKSLEVTVKSDDPNIDDATFLRRLCLDIRGTLPTPVEMWFFVSDADDDKRAKVVDWMTDDDAARAMLAKKLGVPPEQIRVVRLKATADGKFAVFVPDGKAVGTDHNIQLIWADGKNLAVASGGNLHRHDGIRALSLPNQNVVTALAGWIDVSGNADVEVMKSRRNYAWTRVLASDPTNGAPVENASPNSFFKVWAVGDDKVVTDRYVVGEVHAEFANTDTDAEFLKRVLTDVRGSGPTALELKYFTEDKDSKKREKLIDTLLKEPAVQKKLGDAWKAKMLAPKVATFKHAELATDRLFLYVMPDDKQPNTFNPKVIPVPSGGGLFVQPPPPQPPKPPAPPAQPPVDKFEKLVGELIAAKKSDEAILEAITLAAFSRLPTDSEKKLTLSAIATAKDRKAAWVAVAKALAGTDKPGSQTLELKLWIEQPPAPPKPPVSPAKP